MQMLTVMGWRKLMGMDQEEVARRIGITPTEYRNKEDGKEQWTGSELLDLAKVFDTSIANISF